MSILTFISSIFSSNDNSGKTIDIFGDSIRGIGNWIDEKDFTPEEKSKALAEAVTSHLKLIEATRNESSARSITRRWLAFIVVLWTLLMSTVGIVLAVIDMGDKAKIIFDGITVVGSNVLLIAVLGFYFGVQFLRK